MDTIKVPAAVLRAARHFCAAKGILGCVSIRGGAICWEVYATDREALFWAASHGHISQGPQLNVSGADLGKLLRAGDKTAELTGLDWGSARLDIADSRGKLRQVGEMVERVDRAFPDVEAMNRALDGGCGTGAEHLDPKFLTRVARAAEALKSSTVEVGFAEPMHPGNLQMVVVDLLPWRNAFEAKALLMPKTVRR